MQSRDARVVEVSVKRHCGTHYIYPMNSAALIFLKIQNTRAGRAGNTLNIETVTCIRNLGHHVIVVENNGPSGTLERLEAMGCEIQEPERNIEVLAVC